MTTPSGEEMARKWAKFLDDNNLTCMQPCCYEVKKMIEYKNGEWFDSLSEEDRAVEWERMQLLTETGEAGINMVKQEQAARLNNAILRRASKEAAQE